MADIARMARQLYRDGPLMKCASQHWRPYICPYDALIEAVPVGSRVLDVGCGGGLFLAVLSDTKRIAGGTGFDNDAKAVALARAMAQNLPSGHGIEFLHLDSAGPWPAGTYDVVALIDVMHHVAPHQQRAALAQAATCVSPGGILLYKDIAERPIWRALANRLHDLIFARQWVFYVPIDVVVDWAESNGLFLNRRRDIDLLWFRHEIAIFERPN